MNYRFLKSGSLLVLSVVVQLSFGSFYQAVEAKKHNDSATVEPTELHLRDGKKKMEMGDYEGGADEFLSACYFARNKYCPEGWYLLGLCYKETKNYTKGIDAFENHLAQTTEKAPEAHVDLAECYLAVGEYDKAEKQITQARIDSSWKNKRPFYAMGELCEKMGKPGEALESYEQALGDKPWKYWDAWMGKARCEVRIKRWNDAIADYRGLIEAAPSKKDVNFVELYYNMAQCLYKRLDHQGAIDHLLEALKLDPDHFDSHLALAHIFDEEKHITSALNQYENALRTIPKDYNTDAINKRIIYLQGEIGTKEKEKEVKPTPYMRQQQQQQLQPGQQAPAKGESGF